MVELTILTPDTVLAAPKRVVKYILLWCRQGQADIYIDGQPFQLESRQVITITSGQYHQIRRVKGALVRLTFTLDFFSKDDSDIELIFHNGLFCHFGMNEVIRIDNQELFNDLLQAIENELCSKSYQYLVAVHSCIERLLVEINRSKIAHGDEIWQPDALFLNFLEQVRSNFEKNHTVSHFADVLGTTATKLNERSKLHTGKTAQHVIYSLQISEARRLLFYTRFSIKEIAYKLGFSDPFYFSNFFKKHTGMAPLEYRKHPVG